MTELNTILSYVLLYKYAAIAAVLYASALLFPFPANGMLLAVGAFASTGYFNFWGTLALAAAADTLGDLTAYALARIFGERITRALRLHRFRFYGQLQEELRADAVVTVFSTRFGGSLATATNYLAGLVGVPFFTFFWSDLAANITEPFGALAIGYLVGDYWGQFSGSLNLFSIAVAVAVVLFVLFRIHRRMAQRRG